MSKKHKRFAQILNYIEDFFILVSAVTGCVSISDFVSLVDTPREIMRTAVGLKICVITPGIE